MPFGMIGGLRLMLIGFVVAAVSFGFASLVGRLVCVALFGLMFV